MTGNLPVTLRYHFFQFRQTRRPYILLSPALRLLIDFEPRQDLAQLFTEGDSPNSNGISCPYRPGLWCLAIASMSSNFGGGSTPSRSSPSPKLSNAILSRYLHPSVPRPRWKMHPLEHGVEADVLTIGVAGISIHLLWRSCSVNRDRAE